MGSYVHCVRVAALSAALSAGLLGVGCLNPELKPLTPCTVSANVAEVKQNAIDKVDLLFMIDNSNSMSQEQAALGMQLKRLVTILTTGDRDEDGDQDFTPAKDLHVGVISSDMGVGGFNLETCNTHPLGDDGLLRTRGNTTIDGCMPSYPSGILGYRVNGGEDEESFAKRFECIARLGTGGCGFEQQLEAVLKAVHPAEVPIVPGFINGTRGHGGPVGGTGANAGFVRDDSVLAIVIVTDEEDCSLADPSLANVHEPRFQGVNINMRCSRFHETQHPVSRYVDGLKALRADNPELLVVAGIIGVPVDLVADAQNVDPAAILADPRMVETQGPDGSGLVPSCTTASGVAYPPRRIVQAIQEFGDNGVIQSICQSDFRPAIDALIGKISDVLGAVCLPRQLNPDAEGRVGCDVVQVLPTSGDNTRCAGLTERGVDPTPVRIVDGAEVCKINQAPDPDGAGVGLPTGEGWYYDDFSEDVRRSCGVGGVGGQRISFTLGAAPVSGAKVRLECLQPVARTGGPGGTGSIGAICDPAADNCADSSSLDLYCVPELRECQPRCASDAGCPAGLVCYQPPSASDAYCVNPTCGGQ